MVTADTPSAEAIQQRLSDLRELWTLLSEETEKRHKRLVESHKAQQYYFDAAEAEAWMSEQELYMMSEEKAKVDITYLSHSVVLIRKREFVNCGGGEELKLFENIIISQ